MIFFLQEIDSRVEIVDFAEVVLGFLLQISDLHDGVPPVELLFLFLRRIGIEFLLVDGPLGNILIGGENVLIVKVNSELFIVVFEFP